MVRISPSIAKNIMRRSLLAIVDPPPTSAEVEELWKYFSGTCVYCGVAIPRSARTGHLDHLIPSSQGGTNSVFNHALACAKCNGDQKRELTWREFLQIKATDPLVRSEREARIESWLARGATVTRATYDCGAAKAIIAEATDAYSSAVTKMRKLKTGGA